MFALVPRFRSRRSPRFKTSKRSSRDVAGRRLGIEPLEARCLLSAGPLASGALPPGSSAPDTSCPSGDLIYLEDFEQGDGGYVADNVGGTFNGLWHYSTGRSNDQLPNHSPDHAWYYGIFETSTGAGNYYTGINHQGSLTSPVLPAVPDCGTTTLCFSYLLDTRDPIDRDFVEVFVVEMVDGVEAATRVLSREQGTLPETAFEWHKATVDLTPFAGRDIQIRFFFDTGDPPLLDPEGWYVDDIAIRTSCPEPEIALSLAKSFLANADEDTSGTVSLGDTLTYQFTVENSGNVSLTSVSVADPLASVSIDVGTVLPGEAAVEQATYVVTQSDVDAGRIVNTATATSDQTDPVQNTHTLDVPQSLALSFVKSFLANADEDASGTVSLGDTLTYQFTVENSGNVSLTSVSVADPLAGVSTDVGTVLPGEAAVEQATYIVTQSDVDAGRIVNTATATSDQTDPVQNTHTLDVPQSLALSLAKSFLANVDEDTSGTVSLGDTLTYQFTIENSGNVSLTSVSVADPLAGVSTDVGTVLPGEVVVEQATYMVTQSDVDAGRIVNTATATSDQTDPVQNTHTLDVPQSLALSLAKSFLANADEDGSGTVSLGDTLTYQFTVENSGNVSLTSVSVADPLAGVSIDLGTVLPGEAAVEQATYIVTQSDVDAGRIVNTATATSDQTDPVQNTHTLDVPQSLALSLAKSFLANADEDASGTVSLGDTLTYQFTIENSGNVSLTSVSVADPLAGVSIDVGTVLPGEAAVEQATYVVTQSDVDAGRIVNTATATSDQTEPVQNTHTLDVPQSARVIQFITPLSVFRPDGGLEPTSIPENPQIHGFKWHDLNQNGVWDSGELGMRGWTIFVDLNQNGLFDPSEPASVTGGDGGYFFAGLAPGNYTIREEVPSPVESYPASGEGHTVQVADGTPIAGQFGVAESPNFGRFEYAPFVRPADRPVENWRTFFGLGNQWESELLPALEPWQSFPVNNPTSEPVEVTLAREAGDLGGSFLRLYQETDTGLIDQPWESSIELAPGQHRFYVFYQPLVAAWHDDPATAADETVPHTFGRDDHLEVAVEGRAPFAVFLVGGSTFDSDITYDGVVDLADAELLDSKIVTTKWEGLFGWDPTCDLDLATYNRVGPPYYPGAQRALDLGDFGPMNVELGRVRPPFLDLDWNNSRAPGVDHDNTFTFASADTPESRTPSPIAAGDAHFAQPEPFTLAEMTVTITNPSDSGAEQLHADALDTNVDISGNGTGTLVLSGSDPEIGLFDFERVLRTIRYTNTSPVPAAGLREIHIATTGGSDFGDLPTGNVAASTIRVAEEAVDALMASSPAVGASPALTLASTPDDELLELFAAAAWYEEDRNDNRRDTTATDNDSGG